MTGWRIGYLAAEDEKIIKLINKIHQNLNTNVAPFIQYAAIECLSMNKKHLKVFSTKMKINHELLKRKLNKSKIFSLVPSKGALFAFLNISKAKNEIRYFFVMNYLKNLKLQLYQDSTLA